MARNGIEVVAVKSHRNGVGGDGFYTVRFRDAAVCREYDPPLSGEFLAVMPYNYASDDPEMRAQASDVECYVVFLPAPEMCWRGDHFADDVRAAIKEFRAAEEAKWSKPAGGA